MPVVMIIPLLYTEANKINMEKLRSRRSQVTVKKELFFILFVVMAESEGPSETPPRKKAKRQSHFEASWIQSSKG